MHRRFGKYDWLLDGVATQSPSAEPKLTKRIELFSASFSWFLDSFPILNEAGHLLFPSDQWIVLEAGQGKFGWSSFYNVYFRKIYGIDIEDTSRFHPETETLVCDMCQHIPLGDSSVNMIVSHSVLEHVLNVPLALSEFNRILKPGGFLYITVSPLYFSSSGSHVNMPNKLENWEHLDPQSKYYLLDDPFYHIGAMVNGSSLNKMCFSDMLRWTGQQPWTIERSKLAWDMKDIPNYVDCSVYSEVDLRMKGFRLLMRKGPHIRSLHAPTGTGVCG